MSSSIYLFNPDYDMAMPILLPIIKHRQKLSVWLPICPYFRYGLPSLDVE